MVHSQKSPRKSCKYIFDYPILKELIGIKGLDIHDSIIVATAKFLGATLITKDKEIIGSKLINTFWN